jgi:hypothetical protein
MERRSHPGVHLLPEYLPEPPSLAVSGLTAALEEK